MKIVSDMVAVAKAAYRRLDESTQRHWSPNMFALSDYFAQDRALYPLTAQEAKQVRKRAELSAWDTAKLLFMPVAEVSAAFGLCAFGGERALSFMMKETAQAASEGWAALGVCVAIYAMFSSMTMSRGIRNEKLCRRRLAEKVIKHGRPEGGIPSLFLEPMRPQELTAGGLEARNHSWLNA